MILNIAISISDWIQIGIALITLISVITSIAIALTTLKQNSKMIEESTRPCVIFYKDILDINSPIDYLIIKNVGNSIAYITSIEYNQKVIDSLNKDFSNLREALKYLQNCTLAPNQNYKIPIRIKDCNIDTIEFTINYHNNAKCYSEKCLIYLKQDCKVTYVKQHQSNNELQVISNAIQELIKRLS